MNAHRLRVWQGGWKARRNGGRRWWYVECRCGWEPTPDAGTGAYGRRTREAAFDAGVIHQLQVYVYEHELQPLRDEKGRFTRHG